MAASYHWTISNLDQYHTVFYFKRANKLDRLGAMGINGTFYWMISVPLLQEWVDEGGFVVDDVDQEYSLGTFIEIVERCFQILDDASLIDVIAERNMGAV